MFGPVQRLFQYKYCIMGFCKEKSVEIKMTRRFLGLCSFLNLQPITASLMCLMGKGITLISHPLTVLNPPSIIPLPSSSLLIPFISIHHIPFPLSLSLRLPPLTFILLPSSSFHHPILLFRLPSFIPLPHFLL
jgi:hypothetical protein